MVFQAGQLVEVLAGPLNGRQGYISSVYSHWISAGEPEGIEIPTGAYHVCFPFHKDSENGGWGTLDVTIHGDLLRLVE